MFSRERGDVGVTQGRDKTPHWDRDTSAGRTRDPCPLGSSNVVGADPAAVAKCRPFPVRPSPSRITKLLFAFPEGTVWSGLRVMSFTAVSVASISVAPSSIGRKMPCSPTAATVEPLPSHCRGGGEPWWSSPPQYETRPRCVDYSCVVVGLAHLISDQRTSMGARAYGATPIRWRCSPCWLMAIVSDPLPPPPGFTGRNCCRQ